MGKSYLRNCYFIIELNPSNTSSVLKSPSPSFLGDTDIFENRIKLRQFWIDNMLQFGDKRRNIYSSYATLRKLLLTPEMHKIQNDNSNLYHVFR